MRAKGNSGTDELKPRLVSQADGNGLGYTLSGTGEYPDGHTPRDANEGVAEIQRARLLTAMFDVVGKRGASGVTVSDVVSRSGVSRRTFYELFTDREECFLAAFDEAIDRIARVVIAAYEQPEGWRERVRAGLVALLGCFDEERGIARLLVVESLAAGPVALQRRARVLETLTRVIDVGRTESKTPVRGKVRLEIPSLTAEGVVGAVLAVIHARLVSEETTVLSEETTVLLELAGPLMGMIVLPYQGTTVAQREIERPVPVQAEGVRRLGHDPLRELPMRLTYRTVRVLLALARDPGSSNRMVAETAGIEDQGQVSKLLSRLERLGLIENSGPGHAKGIANAWTLTTTGREVESALTHQASHP